MTLESTNAPLDPISAALMALRRWDSCLGALAEVRETFYEGTRTFWDEGISRYLKLRYDEIVDTHFDGDAAKAARYMDLDLANYDVPETVRRAADINDSPLMMEITAYAIALATVVPGQTVAWRAFETIIARLYADTPAKARA